MDEAGGPFSSVDVEVTASRRGIPGGTGVRVTWWKGITAGIVVVGRGWLRRIVKGLARCHVPA